MQNAITPDSIYQKVSDKKLSKEEGLKLLTSILSATDNNELRVRAVKVIGKINPSYDQAFKILENLLTSDESEIVRARAGISLLENFPKQSEEVVKWAILHDRNCYFLKLLVEYLKVCNLAIAENLINSMLIRLGSFYGIEPLEAKFILDWKSLTYSKVIEFQNGDFVAREKVENPDFLRYLRELTVELSQRSRLLIRKNDIKKLHFIELNLNGTLFGRVSKLDSLPSSLSALSKLETLRIEGFHFDTLPEIINQLPSIKVLIISNNEFQNGSYLRNLTPVLESLEFNGNSGFTKVPNFVWDFANRKCSTQRYVEQGVLPSEAPVLALLQILRGSSSFGEGGPILKADDVIEQWRKELEKSISKPGLKKTRYENFSWYAHKIMVYTLDDEGHVNRIKSPYPKMPSIGIFPEQLCTLSHLTELTLVRQKITRVPDCIENLERLEVLDLQYNEIQYLPKSLSKLKNLKKMYIGELEI